MSSNNNTLIITGMHRSGTSMITSYLKECGLELGGRLLVGNEDNPRGYFEDVDFMKMQQDIMHDATKNGKAGWKDVGFTEDDVFDKSVLKNYKKQAQELVNQKQTQFKGIWGWKDPRSTLLLDFWEEIMPDAKYILIYRNPWEVKNSLQKLNKPEIDDNPEYSYQIWIQYNKALLSFYNKNKAKCVFVSVNGFVNQSYLLIDLINEKFNWSLKSVKPDFFSVELFGRGDVLKYLEECLSNKTVLEQFFSIDKVADISSNNQFNDSSENELFEIAKIIQRLNESNLKYEKELKDNEIQLKKKELSLDQLQAEILSLSKSIEIQKNYNGSLNNVIRTLENKIKIIENSRLWKLKRKYHKLKTLLRGSKSGLKNKGIIKKVFYFTSKTGRVVVRKTLTFFFKHGYLFFETKNVKIIESDDFRTKFHSDPWQNFLIKSVASEIELKEYQNNIKLFSFRPKISIIMPVYNTPESFLIQAIESVINQVYTNWELCIADDCSTNKQIRGILEKFAAEDARIKIIYKKENQHISAASNSALELATGEFISLLDHDDLLTKDALYHNVYALNLNIDLDFIYSDEDKIDENGVRSEPHFKPDWCPDNFMARNYITHFVCLRKSIVDQINGFRVGFEGSQDYDLFLRFSEKTSKIYHIPKILYHWRMHSASVSQEENAKPYAFEAGVKALQESLDRRGEKAIATIKPGLPGFYTVRYDIVKDDLISIIIFTKDNSKVLETCLKSIFEKSSYKNFEVILVDNNSAEKATFKLLAEYEQNYPNQFTRLTLQVPFNFSFLMNKAVEKAKGEYIVLLNNDTEIITEDWMEAMLEQSQRKSVGAVGVKLLYHNDTIQHAGVVIGLGGVAGHTFIGLPKDSPGHFYYIASTNNYSAVTAACLMVKKSVYEEVGGFNEELAVEYNDVDFCLKLVEKGYNNLYVPYVELYHYESLTRGHPHMTKESYKRHLKEIALFKNRWKSFIDNDPCYNPNLTLDATHFQLRLN